MEAGMDRMRLECLYRATLAARPVASAHQNNAYFHILSSQTTSMQNDDMSPDADVGLNFFVIGLPLRHSGLR
jgi:hypothetical protein